MMLTTNPSLVNTVDSRTRKQIKDAVFNSVDPSQIRGRQNWLFRYDRILDLWIHMSPREKLELIDANLESQNKMLSLTFDQLIVNLQKDIDGAELGDTWVYPVGRVISDGGNGSYWRFDAMPLEDESGDEGYLFVDPAMFNQKDFRYIFSPKNDYAPAAHIWETLYRLWRRTEKINGIYFGGLHAPHFTSDSLKSLRSELVGQGELMHYVNIQNGRVLEAILGPDIDISKDQTLLQRQQDHRSVEIKIETNDNRNAIKLVNASLMKSREKLKSWLDAGPNDRGSLIEKSYQALMLEIFPFIFPQYTHFIREYRFRIDGNLLKSQDIPDYLALNASLSVDVIEIKTPYVPTFKKGLYRQNYVFGSEIQGLIAQTQKYIYNLTRNSIREEPRIQKEFERKANFHQNDDFDRIHVRSPKAIVVVGRSPKAIVSDSAEAAQQQQDFEIYKRRYQDILSFLTYDDILGMIDQMVDRQSSIQP